MFALLPHTNMARDCMTYFVLCLSLTFSWALPNRLRQQSLISKFSIINDRPIVGVAAQESDQEFGDTYISATYVKYLEQAGARVVPVLAGESEDYYVQLFSRINGVLFPGGSASLTRSQYARTGRILYNLTLQAADQGDLFPLWGTCLGFELLNTITAGQNLLQGTDTENITLPLNLIAGYKNSRMFNEVPEDVVQYLTHEPVTQNEHKYSMLLDVFSQHKELYSFYHPLSTNQGRDGLTFISTFEAYKYPIYGTQWHPEKNAFSWNPNYVINHNAHAVRVAQYFADFFVNEARKSMHRFPTLEEEEEALIDNFNPVYFVDGTFSQMYFFNFTSSTVGHA